jgi:hypothetical protein
MDEIVKHINDTNASYRQLNAGDAKNTDLFLDNDQYQFFEGFGEQITVRFDKENLTKAMLFIASILPRKFDQSAIHKVVSFSKEFVLDQLSILDALFSENGISVNTITQIWNARKDVPKKNGEVDKRFYFNGLLKDISYKDHAGVIQQDKFTIRNYLAGGYSDLHITKAEDGIFDVRVENTTTYLNDGKENGLEEIEEVIKPIVSLQQIFYGAPGTGKSHTINEVTKGEDVIRTTFHPDTDYSGFVGAYKPTTSLLPICNELGEPMKIANQALYKEQIVYEFVAQSFLQAYIAAWKKYTVVGQDEPKKQFLVIEEINRGNCAQIFGDLFQLLDRNDHGFSEYPIKADADMKKQLQKVFNGLDIPQKDSINAMYEDRDVVKEVLDGDLLLLPNNLFIWATMNTSDQSLFPIDSAFKRRWDWTYIPISNANKGWTINIGDSHYDWWQFVERINDLIGRTTNSEDKKLGYFFCKAMEGEISADTFVGKVIFYLWNDVFKDYDFCDQVFNDANGNKLTFDKFYTAEGNNSKVVEEKVKLFLKNLGLEASVQQENMDEDIDSKIIIKVNGKDVTKVNAIPYTAIEEYVKLHSEMSAQEVIDIWKPFKKCSMRSWIVCNKKEHDEMDQRYANYSYEIKCTDGNSLWVNKDGWMHHPENKNLRDTVSEFIEAVNGADLGITITETTI